MNQENNFLPIGTITFMRDEIKPYMIIGYLHMSKSCKLYDYICVPFPYGLMSDSTIKYFNHGDIEKIIFDGYKDEYYFKFSSKLYDKYSILRGDNNG